MNTMTKLVRAALVDAAPLIERNEWVIIKTNYGKYNGNDDWVTLNYGRVHNNGQREIAICTITYEWRWNKLVTIKRVHV